MTGSFDQAGAVGPTGEGARMTAMLPNADQWSRVKQRLRAELAHFFAVREQG